MIVNVFNLTVKASPISRQGEQKPLTIAELVKTQGVNATSRVPSRRGAYRLFAYVYDGKGHFSTANLPFYMR